MLFIQFLILIIHLEISLISQIKRKRMGSENENGR